MFRPMQICNLSKSVVFFTLEKSMLLPCKCKVCALFSQCAYLGFRSGLRFPGLKARLCQFIYRLQRNGTTDMRYCRILSLLTHHQAWEVLWMASQMLQLATIDKDLQRERHCEKPRCFPYQIFGFNVSVWDVDNMSWMHITLQVKFKHTSCFLGFPAFFIFLPHKTLHSVL